MIEVEAIHRRIAAVIFYTFGMREVRQILRERACLYSLDAEGICVHNDGVPLHSCDNDRR